MFELVLTVVMAEIGILILPLIVTAYREEFGPK